MDWTIVYSILGAALTGGGLSWLFKIREDKASSKTDVITKAADAMAKLLDNFEKQQVTFGEALDGKDLIIKQQQELLDRYKETLEDANQKMRGLEYKVAEYERKLAGMQRIIDSEIKDRKMAENNICFVNECKLRQPKLGTYKKENNGI